MSVVAPSVKSLTALQQLAYAYNIELGFHDVFGQYHAATETALQKVLGLFGVDCTTEAAVAHALRQWETRQWQRPLEPVMVIREADTPLRITLRLPLSQWSQPVQWHLQQEDGSVHTGQWEPGNQAEQVTDNLIDGQPYCQGVLTLPIVPPLGYHTLAIQGQSQPPSRLIRVPNQCYLPERLRYESGTWGAAAQLYSLRSDRNWGLGDLTDLRQLMGWAASHGAGFVGLNPLHDLFPHNPHHFSPYSPSSRQFFNSLYLDVQAAYEYNHCQAAQALVASEEYQHALGQLRSTELIDYPWVSFLKHRVLNALYDHFVKEELPANSWRAQDFQRFVKAGGQALRRFAIYQSLHEHFAQQDEALWGWPVWPQDYRSPDSAAVEQFAAEHPHRVGYFQYLQFLMSEQLKWAGDEAIRLGMPIGLYMDVAVGANLAGADLWCDQAIYVQQASVGCPPDAFNQLGQDWGLPPVDPWRLRDSGYDSFIRMIRANMQYAGALRIDHALALFRIFWIPTGENGTNGAYVRFHADELLGILALESHRNGCIVIGEDLGTIPDFVKEGLAKWGALSYKVYFFEKEADGRMMAPQQYPWLSLVTASTHDLPTLAGLWQGADITLRQELGLFPTETQRQEALNARPAERAALIDSLIAQGLVDASQRDHLLSQATLPTEAGIGVQRYLAKTPARMQAIQLEDLLGLTTQMNMPGTTDEHPNWRRRLPVSVNELDHQPPVRPVLDGVAQEPLKAVRPMG